MAVTASSPAARRSVPSVLPCAVKGAGAALLLNTLFSNNPPAGSRLPPAVTSIPGASGPLLGNWAQPMCRGSPGALVLRGWGKPRQGAGSALPSLFLAPVGAAAPPVAGGRVKGCADRRTGGITEPGRGTIPVGDTCAAGAAALPALGEARCKDGPELALQQGTGGGGGVQGGLTALWGAAGSMPALLGTGMVPPPWVRAGWICSCPAGLCAVPVGERQPGSCQGPRVLPGGTSVPVLCL